MAEAPVSCVAFQIPPVGSGLHLNNLSENRGPSLTPAVEEEVTRQREESYQAALRSERRRGMQSFLRVVIILVIDLLVFVPHWFLARRIKDASMVS